MKKILLALLLISQPAYAWEEMTNYSVSAVLLNGVACNASAAARTITLNHGTVASETNRGFGWGLASLYVKFVRSAATNVTMVCTESPDGGTTDYTPQATETINGVHTSINSSWLKTTSVSANWPWRVDLHGSVETECVFSCASGGGSDTLTVTVFYSTTNSCGG